MKSHDYTTAPIADGLGLQETILGLANDIQELRRGEISPQDALARATLAKQMFNGVRMYIQASKFIAENARPLPPSELLTQKADD